jgi:hypothetical protein
VSTGIDAWYHRSAWALNAVVNVACLLFGWANIWYATAQRKKAT